MKRLKSWKKGLKEFRKKHGNYWKYVRSGFWRDKCKKFLKDFDGKCEWCDKKIKNPEVHHKHYKSLGYENRSDVNLICKKCHKNHHEGREIFPFDIEDIQLIKKESLKEELLSNLKIWRLKKAREENLPAYCVFHNKSFEDLINKKPKTKKGLSRVHGFGNFKIEKYGDEILCMINNNDGLEIPERKM